MGRKSWAENRGQKIVGRKSWAVPTLRLLLAEPPVGTTTKPASGINSDTSIGHNRITENSLYQVGRSFFEVDILSSETATNDGTVQISSGQVDTFHTGAPKIASPHDGIRETRIIHDGMVEMRTTQISSLKINTSQIGRLEPGSLKISASEVDLFQRALSQISLRKVDFTQINSIQGSISAGMPLQINPSEVSLTSSVTAQQFTGSTNLFSSHNFNLQNTTIPTWTEFLTGTTPFNLNIEILDLPTGQLAEANITAFDPSGRPTSGTLTLDTDANGLGWFIDSTPWENGEFGMANGETLFRATLGSAAYGHYDLLTTILHELGHLAGLISGTPTYDD